MTQIPQDQQPATPPRVRRQSVRTMMNAPVAPAGEQAPPTATPAPEIQDQQPTPTPVEAQAAEQPQEAAKPKRLKLGWPIRADLIKTVKQIALNTDIHDYEALEQLLEEALEQRAAQREQKQQEI